MKSVGGGLGPGPGRCWESNGVLAGHSLLAGWGCVVPAADPVSVAVISACGGRRSAELAARPLDVVVSHRCGVLGAEDTIGSGPRVGEFGSGWTSGSSCGPGRRAPSGQTGGKLLCFDRAIGGERRITALKTCLGRPAAPRGGGRWNLQCRGLKGAGRAVRRLGGHGPELGDAPSAEGARRLSFRRRWRSQGLPHRFAAKSATCFWSSCGTRRPGAGTEPGPSCCALPCC